MVQKRISLSLLIIASTAAIIATIKWPNLVARHVASRIAPQVLWSLGSHLKIVAITFDDGPNNIITPRILDLLAKHEAKATFFCIGDRIPGNEVLLHRIVQDKHELGNHLMTESASIRLSPDEFEQQLMETHCALSRFAPVKFFRPGSGWFTPRMLNIAHTHGYTCALGTDSTLDTESLQPEKTARRLVDRVSAGSIVVLHEGKEKRIGVLHVTNLLITSLKHRGFALVTLSGLAKAQQQNNAQTHQHQVIQRC